MEMSASSFTGTIIIVVREDVNLAVVHKKDAVRCRVAFVYAERTLNLIGRNEY